MHLSLLVEWDGEHIHSSFKSENFENCFSSATSIVLHLENSLKSVAGGELTTFLVVWEGGFAQSINIAKYCASHRRSRVLHVAILIAVDEQ